MEQNKYYEKILKYSFIKFIFIYNISHFSLITRIRKKYIEYISLSSN